jgi:hypothetical protein
VPGPFGEQFRLQLHFEDECQARLENNFDSVLGWMAPLVGSAPLVDRQRGVQLQNCWRGIGEYREPNFQCFFTSRLTNSVPDKGSYLRRPNGRANSHPEQKGGNSHFSRAWTAFNVERHSVKKGVKIDLENGIKNPTKPCARKSSTFPGSGYDVCQDRRQPLPAWVSDSQVPSVQQEARPSSGYHCTRPRGCLCHRWTKPNEFTVRPRDSYRIRQIEGAEND